MVVPRIKFFFFFSSRRRHTSWPRDWSSDVCSSDLADDNDLHGAIEHRKRVLAEVKAKRGRAVEIAVDVVHEMEAPEKCEPVVREMPEPERVVEQEDCQHEMR